MPKNKLTEKQIMQIPELKKTMSVLEIGKVFKVSPRTIEYWIPKLEKAGYKITKSKGGRKPVKIKPALS